MIEICFLQKTRPKIDGGSNSCSLIILHTSLQMKILNHLLLNSTSDLNMKSNVQYFFFRNPSQCFWKNIKIFVLENSSVNRWFSLVHFSEVILVFAVLLKWNKIPGKKSSVYWRSCMFYIPILWKVVITL